MKEKRIKEIIEECQDLLAYPPCALSETGITVKEVLELAKMARKQRIKEERRKNR